MGIYVQIKCADCGEVLFPWQHNFQVIGKPFIICPDCKSYVIMSDKINEWKLNGIDDKLIHITTVIFWGISGGVLSSMVVISILDYFDKIDLSGALFDITTPPGILMAVLTVISVALCLISFLRSIKKSNTRLRDPQYLEILKELRLIK